MPRYPACSSAPLYGNPIQTYFTYPAVDETTGLTIELPTSEPTEAQVSYTIAAGHLPTLTGAQIAYELAPQVWAYGRNTSGGAATISYRMSLNSTSVATATSSSITNAFYWSFSSRRGWGSAMPVVGDVLNIKLWASATGVYLNAKAMAICVTRPLLPNLGLALVNNMTVESAGAGAPSFGMPSSNEGFFSVYRLATTAELSYSSASVPVVLFSGNTSYGIMRNNYGDDYSSASLVSGESFTIIYYQQRLLSLSLLPLNIKL